MAADPETHYRNRLELSSDCMLSALDSVIPADPADDTAASRLSRQLSFDPAQADGMNEQPFARRLPLMQDHGLRQVALMHAAIEDDEIRDRLPGWLNPQTFGQAILNADVGLVFVGAEEVATVNKYGPRFGRNYNQHPAYGYAMAQELRTGDDVASQFITAFIARHHMVQAKHRYGLGWNQIDCPDADPLQVDIAVALGKPFDYVDDYYSRRYAPGLSFEAQVVTPCERFAETFDILLSSHDSLAAAKANGTFDPALPALIAATIPRIILDGGPRGIGDVYFQLRPDLAAQAVS